MYLYSLDGQQLKRLTEGAWEVTDVAGVDEFHQKVYFVSTEASPLDRELYSVRLNGKDRTKISQRRGYPSHLHGTHGRVLSRYFSSLTEPPRSELVLRERRRVVKFSRGEARAGRRVRGAAIGDLRLKARVVNCFMAG